MVRNWNRSADFRTFFSADYLIATSPVAKVDLVIMIKSELLSAPFRAIQTSGHV